jgi:hypothetical protein
VHRLEAGQPVAEPTDRRLWMPLLAFASHTVRGLDRHDVPATAGKPAGIAARAGSNVEDEARPFGDEVERVLVAVLERRALVEVREHAGVPVVCRDGIAHGAPRQLRLFYTAAGILGEHRPAMIACWWRRTRVALKLFVGMTDRDWYELLRQLPELDEVNFWACRRTRWPCISSVSPSINGGCFSFRCSAASCMARVRTALASGSSEADRSEGGCRAFPPRAATAPLVLYLPGSCRQRQSR